MSVTTYPSPPVDYSTLVGVPVAAAQSIDSSDVLQLLAFAMRRINFLEQALGAGQIVDDHAIPSSYSLIEEDSQWT
jgi:hypothetical protein